MTQTPCTVPNCRRRVTDAFVCSRCAADLVTALTDYPATSTRGPAAQPGIAALVIDLELAASRESRLSAPTGAQDDETPLSYGHAGAEAAWVLANTLGTWVRSLCEDRGVPLPMVLIDVAVWPRRNPRRTLPRPAQIIACADLLVRCIESVRQSPAGGELVDEVRSAVTQARSAVDRRPSQVFCGRCTHCITDPVLELGPDLLAAPAATEVACPNCGWTYRVDVRQQALLEEVRDRLGTAAEVAGLLAELFGIRVDIVRISQWKGRGRLPVRGERRGHPTYRIGDVIDLAQWEAPRPQTAAR